MNHASNSEVNAITREETVTNFSFFVILSKLLMKLFFIFLFIPLIFFPQETKIVLPLTSIYHSDDMSDLKQLDSVFANRTIIGVGESTHGTSEFTTMRLRLFRYLVENHQFNTFFLEADFAACQRVNRYIHGAKDSVRKALLEVRLWPWLTYEMVELIEWMREYNADNNNALSIVGCDMQLQKDDAIELKRMALTMEFDTLKINEIYVGLKYPYADSVIKKSFKKWGVLKEELVSLKFSDDMKKDLLLHVSTVDQWFEANVEGKGKWSYNFRDSCMAVNMLYYLRLHQGSKGMYFAHNWHVSKTKTEYAKNFYPKMTTGKFIEESLGRRYFAIAQVSNEGEYNVFKRDRKTKGLKMINHQFGKAKKHSIRKVLNEYGESLFYVTRVLVNPKNKFLMTNVGAVIGKYGKNKYATEYIRYNQTMFDAFIFIKTTSPTHLIKRN